jgi:hypothetical protein
MDVLDGLYMVGMDDVEPRINVRAFIKYREENGIELTNPITDEDVRMFGFKKKQVA